MIRHNIIQNFRVMVKYIDIAEKIFGSDVSTLEVTTTEQRPKLVVDDFIEIPRDLIENNQELILCMDIIFINKQALLTKIDKYIRFPGLVLLDNRIKEECYRTLDVVMIKYNKSGFCIKRIGCDSEFKSIMDEVSDEMGIETN